MMTSEQIEWFNTGEGLDFALASPDGSRVRVNVFRSKGQIGAVLRLLNTSLPTAEQFNLPPVILEIANQPRGLILVTGPTGSGKSTTLAAMINHINMTKPVHIFTIEDSVEYIYLQGVLQ